MSFFSWLGFCPEYSALLAGFIAYAWSFRSSSYLSGQGGHLVVYPKYVFSFLCIFACVGGGLFLAHGERSVLDVGTFLYLSPLVVFLKLVLFSSGLIWGGFRSKIVRRSLERDGIFSFSYAFFVCMHLFASLLLLSAYNLFLLALLCILQSICWIALQYREEALVRDGKSFNRTVLHEGISLFVLLIGCTIVYSGAGSLSYHDFAQAVQDGIVAPKAHVYWTHYGVILFTFYFLLKLCTFPFNLWDSRYSEGAPKAVLAVTACQQFSFLFVFGAFLFYCVPHLIDKWQPILFWVGILTLASSSLHILLRQSLCAFISSLMGFAVGVSLLCFSIGKVAGLTSSVFYFILFFVALMCFLFFILNISVNDQNVSQLSEVRGLSHSYPGLSVILAMCLLSFVAFPPFAGFWTALYVLKTLISKGWIFVAIILMGMVLSSFQYFHVMRLFYFSGALLERRLTDNWKTSWLLIPLLLVLFPLFHRHVIQFISEVVQMS